MKTKLTLTQTIEGYELAIQARHLSKHTLLDYKNTFRKLIAYLGDPPFTKITHQQINAFLAAQTTVSNKTILNYHTGLSALWTWALSENLVADHILRRVVPPKPEKPEINPFTETDLKALLDATEHTNSYLGRARKPTVNHRPCAIRDRAIILLMIDTGLRATELCELALHQCDLRNKRITVWGKGSKQRTLPISARTGQAIWRYINAERSGDTHVGEPLFVTSTNSPLDHGQLLRLMMHAGERAKVSDVHPHRFRHTFAIQYLRNGGDTFTLQRLLGHSTMEMVRTYLQIAQADLETAHRRASPVDNWRL
jgi:site-specific recombinase XerD